MILKNMRHKKTRTELWPGFFEGVLKDYIFFVVSFLEVSILAVSIIFFEVSVLIFAELSFAVVSAPLEVFDDIHPIEIELIIAATRAIPKMCFFID
jgi:hypothetical protein